MSRFSLVQLRSNPLVQRTRKGPRAADQERSVACSRKRGREPV